MRNNFNAFNYNFLGTTKLANLKVCKFQLTYENESTSSNLQTPQNTSIQMHP